MVVQGHRQDDRPVHRTDPDRRRLERLQPPLLTGPRLPRFPAAGESTSPERGPVARSRAREGGTPVGDCVEVADLAAHVVVRDSKGIARPHVRAAPAAFVAFGEAAARGCV
ncbi:DUF397 domain-containing protein [Streptomyces sp. NPDC014656]|uniref:DUF397 domain-containing protein n=1 Tax=Streptomyces sp. NPDC014656 TaxID=3364878 RepID=UPI0036FFC3E7